MDHVAILKRSFGFKDKILSGEKTVESRWYFQRRAPWNGIHAGDMVYFKNSGEAVTLCADVKKVMQFSDLSPVQVKKIVQRYGVGIGLDRSEQAQFIKDRAKKKYCILIFLKNPQRIKPFMIDKSGFGSMAAWISVPKINKIKIKNL